MAELIDKGMNTKTGLQEFILDIGKQVFCDYCNEEFTDSEEKGGFLFSGYAVCPQCEPKQRKSITSHGECKHIKAECPVDMSFRDFVYSLR